MGNLIFIGITLAALALVFEPLRGLINSGRTDYYSHIVLIPLVSVYFTYTERKGLLGNPSPSLGAGSVLVIAGLALYLMGFTQNTLNQNDRASCLSSEIMSMRDGLPKAPCIIRGDSYSSSRG